MTSASERLDALTGLRFVAAAAVFIYHLPNWLQVPAFNPGPLGQAAVGYFFVLSGFILAHVYRRDGTNMSTGRFYRARFARVWPLHIACLIAMLAIRPASIPDTPAAGLHLLTHVALLQGWAWDSGWAQAWNAPAWSLSVEAFFYAVFPLLVARRTGTLIAIYAICCLANAALYAAMEQLAVTRPERTQDWAYLASSFPLPRLQEFVLGICAHAFWRHHAGRLRRGPLAATLLELCAFAAAAASYFTWASGQWGPAWIGAGTAPITVSALAQGPGLSWAFAATIVLGAVGAGWLSRALATRAMVYLGEISYAIYLVHTPVMALVSAGMRDFAFLWQVPLLVGASATLTAAAWLHALVEAPARQALLAGGPGFGRRIRVYLAALGVATRTRPLMIVTLLAGCGLAFGSGSQPTVDDFSRGIARQSEPVLRGVRYGAGVELLGATLAANAGGFTCWVALTGTELADVRAAIEARTRDGQLVHALTCSSRTATDDDGKSTIVLTAQTDLIPLIGASVLTLVVRDANGTVRPPSAGPIGTDRTSLELLRLP